VVPAGGIFPPVVPRGDSFQEAPLKIAVFSWVVVSAQLMGDSLESLKKDRWVAVPAGSRVIFF